MCSVLFYSILKKLFKKLLNGIGNYSMKSLNKLLSLTKKQIFMTLSKFSSKFL